MDNTVSLIGKAGKLTSLFIQRKLQEMGMEGIVPSHGDIIVALIKKESITMKEIAKMIDRDPSTVTTLVKKLVKLGYLQTSRDVVDKRAVAVSLTEMGKKVKDEVIEISEEMFEIQYRNISDEEVQTFRAVLQKIISNFDDELNK